MAKPETVSCPCGATIEVELDGEASLDAVCPECGMMLEVMVSVDPRTKTKRVGILVKSQSVAPRRSSKPKSPGAKTEEVHVAKCTCGAQLTIVPGGSDAIYTCDACEAEYTASFKPGRTGAVLVLRPVLAMPMAGGKPATTKAPAAKAPASAPKAPPAKAPAAKAPEKPAPAPAPKPAAAAKPPPPALPPPVPTGAAAKENQLLMTKADIAAQEVEGDAGNQKVACLCGEALRLKGEFHREIHKCAACNRSYRIFAAVHPKTGGTMAVMIPRESGK